MTYQQRLQESWSQGTADAVYQNLDIVGRIDPDFILILAGDHVYKMDYGALLGFHLEKKAELTIGCIEVPRSEAQGFGFMQIDERNMIIAFLDKPEHPPTTPGRKDVCLTSIGIYTSNTGSLCNQLIEDALILHDSTIGLNCRIHRAIVDKRYAIPDGAAPWNSIFIGSIPELKPPISGTIGVVE